MIIGPGITIGGGIYVDSQIGAGGGGSIGSTASTVTPTLNGFAVGTTNGSPFSTSVNSYECA